MFFCNSAAIWYATLYRRPPLDVLWTSGTSCNVSEGSDVGIGVPSQGHPMREKGAECRILGRIEAFS
jgi:hypothetical protein